MRKKVWVKMHDICLISLREFQDGKADIIHVFDADEARLLQSYGEVPRQWGSNEGTGGSAVEDESNAISFEIDDI